MFVVGNNAVLAYRNAAARPVLPDQTTALHYPFPTASAHLPQYLHAMVRIRDIDASLDFYCNKLCPKETRRYESKQGQFKLDFLAAPEHEDRAKVK